MKLSRIALAVAGASIAVSSNAATISGGSLAGLETREGGLPGVGVSAVAMIVPGSIHNGLQKAQGMPVACVGNRDKVCAPSMSSAEVRGLLNNSYSNTAVITGSDGSVLSNIDATNFTGVVTTKAALFHGRATAGNVDDALEAFVHGGNCGPGAALEAGSATASGLDDAATLATIAAGNVKGIAAFIHATELDDSNSDYGFVKIDGVAPDLVNLMSSNYPLVSNLHGASLPSTASTVHGMTVGVTAAGAGLGVAYHNFVDTFSYCAPLDTSSSVSDVNGGSL